MTWLTAPNMKSLMLIAGVGAISGSGLLLMVRSSFAMAGQRRIGAFRLAAALLILIGGFYGCHLITGQNVSVRLVR